MQGRVAWKRRIGRLYTSLRARDAHRKVILLYHSIGGGPEANAKEDFSEHIGAIAALGELRSLESVLEAPAPRKVAVAITFDDGYATLRDHAAPILKEFGCAATAFVNVSQIGDDVRLSSKAEEGYYPSEDFLTWHDVEALGSLGWRFGSHGVRHLDLTTVDATTVDHELSASKRVIEQRLGTACEMFAYPWGRNSPMLCAKVETTGYRYAFSGDHLPLRTKSNAFALPRINVAKEYAPDDLVAILRGDWDYLHWIAKARAVMG